MMQDQVPNNTGFLEGGNVMLRNKILSIMLVMIAFLSMMANSNASTINASTCSQANVQAAIDSAKTGDIVAIPGTGCTWTSGVSVPTTKKITLQGAGYASTVITTSIVSPSTAIMLNESGSRITGIGFIQKALLPQKAQIGG
jgi:Flp pilus assembly protein TadG